MKTHNPGNTFFALIFGVVAGIAPIANADNYGETYIISRNPSSDLRTATVNYADLDLAGSAGQQQLQRRIERAARQVCGSVHLREAGSIYQARLNRQCQERAESDALNQVYQRQIASVAQ